MKRIALSLGLMAALSLGGCAGLTKVLNTPIPTGKLEGLITTGAGVITAADGYVAYCTHKPAPVGCNGTFIKTKVFPGVDKLQGALDTAQAWIAANNGKTFAPANIYDGLSTAITTVENLNIQKVPAK